MGEPQRDLLRAVEGLSGDELGEQAAEIAQRFALRDPTPVGQAETDGAAVLATQAEADRAWAIERMAEGARRVDAAEPATVPEGDATAFGHVRGLPEVHVDELTPQVIADALAARSGLIVRELLPDEAVQALREDLAFMRVMKAVIARSRAEGTLDTTAMLASWREDLGSLKMSASTLRKLVGFYEASGVTDVVSRYLGARAVGIAARTEVRRNEREGGLQWHQDAAFLGGRVQALDIWTALTPVGDRCPSVDVLPLRLDHLVGIEEPEAMLSESLLPLTYLDDDHRAVDELTTRATPYTAVLAPGDAVLLDEMTLHRTGVAPWTLPYREVAVTWFFAPSRFPVALGRPYAV